MLATVKTRLAFLIGEFMINYLQIVKIVVILPL